MKKFRTWLTEMNGVGGGAIRGMGMVTGSPDGTSSNYATNNAADADQRSADIAKASQDHTQVHLAGIATADTKNDIMNRSKNRKQ